jgi:hypothetical protein
VKANLTCDELHAKASLNRAGMKRYALLCH